MIDERGSAMVEMLLLTGLFVPLLFGIALVGKYIDLKSASLEAARYVVWERTVWSDPASRWHAGAAGKHRYELAEEADAYVLGHPAALIGGDLALAANPLRVNRNGRALLTGAAEADARGRPRVLAGQLELLSDRAPASNALVDGFASGPVLGRGIGSAAAAVGSQLGALVPGCGPGVDYERGLGLRSRNFAVARVSVPARNELDRTGAEFWFSASAAILSDSWTSSDSTVYRQRVDGLTVDELVGCAVAPGRVFSALALGSDAPLYGEGQRSYPVIEAFAPDALPREAP